jgi:hypothetical protein
MLPRRGGRRGKAIGWRWLLVWAAASMVAACAPPPREPSPPPLTARRQVPIGLCEDYPEENRSLDGARQDFELMRRLGVKTLRVSFGWDSLEPERDRYDFAYWDAFVDLAVNHYGLTLIPYVAYTPAWNSAGSDTDFWKTPPRQPAEFAELLGLLAARYRGRIHSWELWNEPDNRDYWLGSAAEYAELARGASAAIEAVDPAIDVVSGGLAGHVEFLTELFDRFDAGRSFDVINLHAYYETWNPEPIETLSSYVADVADIVRRHGGRQAIWMAEVGYGNYRNGGHVSDFTSAIFAHEHTLDYQAVALARSLGLLLASPVSLIAWYELKDPAPTDAMIGDVNNRHLGVAFADRRLKPAASTLAFFTRLFAGGFSDASARLDVAPRGSIHSARVQGFLSARDTLILIAWLSTPDRPPGPSTGPGAARDERREWLRVRAPYRARGVGTAYDALGRERGAPHSPTSSGSALDLELEIVGGDVLIVEVPVELE